MAAAHDRRHAPPATRDRRLPPVLLVLTATTGLIDAVSYLGLGHVFTANMTGNIVLLGFGLAGTGGLPVVAPLVSLGAFVLGAGLGGWIAARLAERRRRHLGVTLTLEAALLAGAALLTAAISVTVGSLAAYLVIALVAIAMGVRNATVRKLAVPDLTTTVMTLTLTGLVADPAGGAPHNSARRAGAVLALLAGALVGALLEQRSLALALAIAAGAAVAMLVAFLAAGRRSVGS
ncbi:MAG TPA: YoaK family protein [Solirubrobacteraceae bacterium]|nr:YoaK family protein [Solirubrobacteraceae bacterium]